MDDHGGKRAPDGAGPVRLLLRFGLGVGELAGEGLAISLRLFTEARTASDQAAAEDAAAAIDAGGAQQSGVRAAPADHALPLTVPTTVRHMVIGALATAPD